MDNLLAASEKAGAGHFVILSIVGVDHVHDLDYYRAKVLQEDILKAGPIPCSIVRPRQFMEVMDATLSMTTDGDTVLLSSTPIQPIAAADVSSPLDELGRLTVTAKRDGRSVVTDDTAGMFAVVHGDAITARNDARIAPTHCTDWLS